MPTDEDRRGPWRGAARRRSVWLWRRRLVVALLLSLLLHLGLLTLGGRRDDGPRRLTARPTRPLPPLTRWRPTPAPSLSRGLLERVRAAADLPALPAAGLPPAPALPGVEPTEARLPPPQTPAPKAWTAAVDSLDVSRSDAVHVTDLPVVDPVAFDAEGTARTVVLIDAATGKLKRAILHMPAYGAGLRPDGTVVNPGQGLMQALELIRRGFRVPDRVPVTETVHTRRLGTCSDRAARAYGLVGREVDPIHGTLFRTCLGRQTLRYQELLEYPVVHLGVVDAESTEVLARYVLAGGTVILDVRRMARMRQVLEDRVGSRVTPERLELGHPLFHAYYDITRYRAANACCDAVAPVLGVAVDGRVALLTSPAFSPRCPCPSNRLYVNVLAFALMQPSALGGRFVDSAMP